MSISPKNATSISVRAGLIRQLIASAQFLPGVADGAVTSALPLNRVAMQNFRISGRSEAGRDDSPIADVALVSPGFFQKIETAAGRRAWVYGYRPQFQWNNCRLAIRTQV